ncbi:MAG TPA: hypothetical protein VMU30_01785, partial [Bacteroidota bacterium]|nr:hypothetical protein [Bacteroidota bacterium]
MRYSFIVAIVVSIFFIGFHSTEKSPAPSTTAYQDKDANVGFQWAFGAMIGKEKKFVPILRDTVLK